jgi:putative ABC transport system permease protein
MHDRHGLRRLFRLPSSPSTVRRDVEEEIAFHIEQATRERIESGMPPDAAREAAERAFGDVGAARVELEAMGRRRLRRAHRMRWWGDFIGDMGHGLRAALNAPLFFLLAAVTLALGIGANAAIFGVAKPVLLDPLPFPRQAQLLRIYAEHPGEGGNWGLTAGMIDDMTRMQTAFASHAAFVNHPQQVVLDGDGGGGARVARATWVEPRFFDVLDMPPLHGRGFRDEDAPSGPSYALIVTHAAWQRLFAGDSGIIGREVRVNDHPREVVGILPPQFVGPIGDADFYFPLNLAPTLADPVRVRRSHWLGLVARLTPQATLDATRHQLDQIAQQLQTQYPDDFTDVGITAQPLRQSMVGDTRTPLLVLLASAALVLLIACANLSGALLSRIVSRRREFGVRTALGAGRGRLVRQLLAESMVLAVAGGIAAIGLSALTLALLRGVAAPSLPHFATIALDGGTIAGTLLLTVFTGLLIGTLPALAVARGEPQRALADSSRGGSDSPRARRLRGGLVAGQIALCLSLVVSAGLLGRSLWNMSTADAGFTPAGVLAATVQLPSTRYASTEAIQQFHERLLATLSTAPGILAVATSDQLPREVGESNGFEIDGAPWRDGESAPFVMWSSVSDDYFRTLQIPLRAGRPFDARDHADAPRTVIINESMARRWWPNGDAVGARLRIGPDREAPWHTVIGIVGDVRHDPVRADAPPITYVSTRQSPSSVMHVLLRSHGDPLAQQRLLEQSIAALDPALPLRRVITLDAVLGERLAAQRLPAVLMGAFGALALLLASVGVYAMFATMAAAREREFGVRMALGADRRSIATLVFCQGATWMGVGIAGGIVGIAFIALLLRDLLFGVSPFDPLTLAIALGVLAVCAAAASLTPIRRATRVDPAAVLQGQ